MEIPKRLESQVAAICELCLEGVSGFCWRAYAPNNNE
jgi:hypothetical protein